MHDALPDDAQRVAILIDWLGPSVRRRIETQLTAPQGYTAALDYLQEQYGRPERISHCRVLDLLGLSVCKIDVLASLQLLADQLHGMVVVLQQAGDEHNLKSDATLEQAVQKLPMPVSSCWARLVIRMPRSPDLSDLDQLLRVEEERLMRPTEELTANRESVQIRDKSSRPSGGHHSVPPPPPPQS